MPKAKKEELSLESLPRVGGGVVAGQFNRDLNKAIQDCYDRPNDPTARVVTLKVQVAPVPDATRTGLDAIETTVLLSLGLPKAKTRPYQMALRTSKDARGRDQFGALFEPLIDEVDAEIWTPAGDGEGED